MATRGQREAGGMLRGVQVDAAPYLAAAGRQSGENAWSLITRGHLLLMADEPAAAREAFEQAYRLANSERQQSAAAEGIARSIKAVDGAIGRANAWALSLRGGE